MKKLTMTLASAATLSFIGLTAAPAFAVTGPALPTEDKLYVIECDSTDAPAPLQLFGVTPETAALTEIGSGLAGPNNCAYQGAQEPGTDWFYSFDGATLFRIDLLTGDTEVIGDFTNGGLTENGVYSMTFGPDGTAYAMTYDELFTVDLVSAELTYLSTPDVYGIGSGYPYAFAYDYVTQKFYFVEDGYNGLYEVVPSTGAKTLVATSGDYVVYSMAFDSDGNLWVNGEGDFVSKLALADFATPAAWVDSPDLTIGQGTLYSESLWVSPKFPAKPELPNTGVDVTGFAALAGLLTIMGVSIVAVRRRA